MNATIKKLIKQSTTIRYSGPGEIEEFDKEKFAELIVKECAGIASEYDAPKMSGPGMIIANRIESHFGVEE
jgi:hypothetical protein